MDSLLQTHVFEVNPEDNSGEAVTITTKFFGNGDPITHYFGVYETQDITIQSYGNSASIRLGCSTLTPEKLRDLADELEEIRQSL